MQGRFLQVSPGSVREICRVEARACAMTRRQRAAYDGFVTENKREGEPRCRLMRVSEQRGRRGGTALPKAAYFGGKRVGCVG